MGRLPVVVALAATLAFAGATCADPAPDFCTVAGPGLPSLDAVDSVSRWAEIEAALSGPRRADAGALRVVASQVARLGDGASVDAVAALVVRPGVVARVERLEQERLARCG